ncbi:MAG: GTP-binding protein [Gammaproteobacteria bacterium]|jgi:GTP-binding protein|tara:strand:- start:543 stop:1937 length:1395 start_codon:yes stop_codon:yes gene_type:complete
MLPAVALIGRPNVGKSTLFNRLTGTRDALVADFPGLTRDRLYGFAHGGLPPFIVIDTGGLTGDSDDMSRLMDRQVDLAVAEADVVLLLVDGVDGLTAGDEYVANRIRKTGKQIVLVVNKAERRDADDLLPDFYSLGFDELAVISASRGDGVSTMVEQLTRLFPESEPEERPTAPEGMKIAVVGRPNVGKSTLVNRLVGEERVLAADHAGTTRDSIYVPFVIDGKPYVLVDTAGIRRRAKVQGTIEKFSIVKALQAIDDADSVIVLLDARDGITDQDVSLIGLVIERGRALAIGVNKWDGLRGYDRGIIHSEMERKLPFLDFADIHYTSALHGSDIRKLLDSATKAGEAAIKDLPTRELNDVLSKALDAHPTPLVRGRRVKLTYAHQGGKRPPIIVLHGNQTDRLPQSYRRYLIKAFRKAFRLKGTPIRLQLKTGDNPFAGIRNKLTTRQTRKRDRMKSFTKKNK